MEFQIAEAIELIKTLAETENLTTEQALTAFVAEAGLDIEYASMLKAKLYEEYTLQEMASDSLSKALYSVFVKGVEVEDIQEVDTKETQEGTKYKIRVQDKQSGSSYVRYATRAKIAELRANPNISSVELTDHGSAGGDDDGQKTAKAKGGGKDHDGDGKVESSSKEHAGVVHNAIQRKMGGKPDGQDTRKEEVEHIGENRRAARAAGGYKDDSKKQTDPSKPGFTGISGSIKDIMRQNKEIEAKTRKEEVEVAAEAIDPKGAARMDAAKGKKKVDVFAYDRKLQAMGKLKDRKLPPAPKNESLWDQYKAVREGATIEEAKKKVAEEVISEADLVDAGRENQSERTNKKLDGKNVDNSTRVKLMPKMQESVVTDTKSSAHAKLFRETAEARSSLQALAEKKGMDLKKFKKDEESQEQKDRDKIRGMLDKEDEAEGKKAKCETVELDAAGMPILEYSQNRRNGPKSEDIAPPKDAEGERGWKNPKGEPKRPKGGDRRPNKNGPDLPNEKGTVPNGSGV